MEQKDTEGGRNRKGKNRGWCSLALKRAHG